jgi:tetratricopeptide (TPR) repeat protein
VIRGVILILSFNRNDTFGTASLIKSKKQQAMNKSSILFILLIFPFLSTFGQSKIEKSFYEGRFEDVLHLLNIKEEKGAATLADYELAAQSCEQLFNYQNAIDNYQKILSLDSTNHQAIEGMANCYCYLGDNPNAFSCYQKILPTDTSNVILWAKYAGVLTDLNKDGQAENIYHKLSEQNPDNLFFARKEALAVYNQRDFNRAIKLFEPYLEKKPDDDAIRLALANCLQKKENYLPAIDQLSILLQKDSLNLVVLNKIGYIYFANLRNYDEAAPYYRTVNTLENNSDPTHLTNLGICEYFVGNHEKAAKLLDSLSFVIANDPFINFYAGLSYKKLGDNDKAQTFLEIAAELAIPAYIADIYHHLGRVYSAKRMPQDAIAAYQKTIEYDPLNTLVFYDMAITYDEFKMGSTIALTYYQEFMKGCKTDGSSEYKYASMRVNKLKEELFFEGN